MTFHLDYLLCFLAGAMSGAPVIALGLLWLRARALLRGMSEQDYMQKHKVGRT